MRKRLALLDFVPKWLLLIIIILQIGLLGYLDYLTGDYSILIFYLIPACLAGWYFGDPGAMLTSLLCGSARCISDYYTYQNKGVGLWNSAEDTLVLLIASLIAANIRRIMYQERQEKGVKDKEQT
jgi:glucose-6-phosphate-specific signal transduction histidine kinase